MVHPLKIEALQYLDLGLLLEAEILVKYVLSVPQYFYMISSYLYILQTRRDFTDQNYQFSTIKRPR